MRSAKATQGIRENVEIVPETSVKSSSGAALQASFPPSVPPPRRDGRKNDTNEYDQGCDLNPDETAEFSKDDFDAIAPRGRQSIADGLDAMRRGPQAPFDPVGPVVKSNSNENPRQDSGNDPETVHLGVTPKPRKVPVMAIHFLPPV
jgi:hypothetical protein